MAFIRVDDGIGLVRGKEKALAASRKVREEVGQDLYGTLGDLRCLSRWKS